MNTTPTIYSERCPLIECLNLRFYFLLDNDISSKTNALPNKMLKIKEIRIFREFMYLIINLKVLIFLDKVNKKMVKMCETCNIKKALIKRPKNFKAVCQ